MASRCSRIPRILRGASLSSDAHNGGISPESPCSICRSYGHFTHNHPEGYVNPMYDVLHTDACDKHAELCEKVGAIVRCICDETVNP